MSQSGLNDSAKMPPPVVPSDTIAQPTVRAIMSTRAVTVTMDDSLARARELFNEHHFHHLLVVQGPTLLGIISDRDLLKAVSPHIGTLSETDRDRATLNKRAHQIMSRKLITVAADTTVEAAAQLLLEHRVSCLPVVTTAGLLEGIITWRDLLREYLRHTPAGG
ncbi:MAG: CBS domain-containing protein [Nitrospira sp.]|nr:CBS domain-containing protein [Nitrospira sp.]